MGLLSLIDASVGALQLTADPRVPTGVECFGLGEVTPCGSAVDETCICLQNLGLAVAGFGSIPICGNACDATPVEETSWGQLKQLF
jgi:hypothetical protein